MKPRSTILVILILGFSSLSVLAQNSERCAHCKMDIKQRNYIAYGELNTKSLSFDAIECMVNYLKTDSELVDLKVTDFNNGDKVDATSAYYLKSNQLPSPMGANISAYSTKAEALKAQKRYGGEVMDWNTLIVRFRNSNFGSVGHHHHHRPDMYGPAGVMGDHLHPKGDIMFSLRSMHMRMDGIRKGNDLISRDEVHEIYMNAPETMIMNMYMLGAMYAINDHITVMAMQNLISNNMALHHQMTMPNGMVMTDEFSTSSSGLGDLQLATLIGLVSRQHLSFHLNVGLSMPLGSIEKRDATPMSEDAKLPYAMQLGSGTFDTRSGGTLRGGGQNLTWGVQAIALNRIGSNSMGYTLGDQYNINSWIAIPFRGSFSFSARINAQYINPIDGVDPELKMMMAPAADPANYDQRRVRALLGVNCLTINNMLLLSIEAGIPVHEYNSGQFMSESSIVNTGVKLIL